MYEHQSDIMKLMSENDDNYEFIQKIVKNYFVALFTVNFASLS